MRCRSRSRETRRKACGNSGRATAAMPPQSPTKRRGGRPGAVPDSEACPPGCPPGCLRRTVTREPRSTARQWRQVPGQRRVQRRGAQGAATRTGPSRVPRGPPASARQPAVLQLAWRGFPHCPAWPGPLVAGRIGSQPAARLRRRIHRGVGAARAAPSCIAGPAWVSRAAGHGRSPGRAPGRAVGGRFPVLRGRREGHAGPSPRWGRRTPIAACLQDSLQTRRHRSAASWLAAWRWRAPGAAQSRPRQRSRRLGRRRCFDLGAPGAAVGVGAGARAARSGGGEPDRCHASTWRAMQVWPLAAGYRARPRWTCRWPGHPARGREQRTGGGNLTDCD